MSSAKSILQGLSPEARGDLLARLDRLVDRSGGPDACWAWTRATVRNRRYESRRRERA